MSSKDIRQLIKKLEAQGFEVEKTKKNHHRVTKNGVRVATLPGTPSDSRGLKNSIADCKRHGFIP